MFELLRPKQYKEKYARPMDEIFEDLEFIKQRAFYIDLAYYLESERANAIMTLKNEDSDEARAKWKIIDKIFNRYENLRKEVLERRQRENNK